MGNDCYEEYYKKGDNVKESLKIGNKGKASHPMQPLEENEQGHLRFKENKIVKDLLDNSRETGMNLNDISCMAYSQEDREQFAQLIGYSINGFDELGYVRESIKALTRASFNQEITTQLDEKNLRIEILEESLKVLGKSIASAHIEAYNHCDNYEDLI